MKKDWQFIKKECVYTDRILSIDHKEYFYKKENESMVFTTQNMSNWVLIVPVMKDGRFILVRQFRAGTESDTYEFPGGSIDINEEPSDAAVRELAEETGARAEKVVRLGVLDPNPAFMTNKCNVFFAENCEITCKPHLDKFEDAEAVMVTYSELKDMIRSGVFTQSLSIAGLMLYENNR